MPNYLFCNRRENPFEMSSHESDNVWRIDISSVDDDIITPSTAEHEPMLEPDPMLEPTHETVKRGRGRPRKYQTPEELRLVKKEHARKFYLSKHPPKLKPNPPYLEDRYTKYECPECTTYFCKPCYYTRNHRAYHFEKSLKHRLAINC